MRKNLTIVLSTLLLSLLAAAGGLSAFLYSGVYDIAAARPHLQLTEMLLTTLKRRAVRYYAQDLEVPELRDPALIARGFQLYEQQCLDCHGAPGVAPTQMGIGLNPTPPPLLRAAYRWRASEIAWITANGLKMAGMPAFSQGADPLDLWAITAFICRLDSLDPLQYQQMKDPKHHESAPWLEVDQGWELLAKRGIVTEGRRLARDYGCLACHHLEDSQPRAAAVGPPLGNWAERHFIAGRLINAPNSLQRWIRTPHAILPQSAMPELGLSEQEAWHIAAYLYSLGERQEPNC